MVAAPGFAAFLDGSGGSDEGGNGVGPPPAEEAVEQQPGEQHRGQVGAQQRLLGIGDRAGRAELPPGAALGVGRRTGITTSETAASTMPTVE